MPLLVQVVLAKFAEIIIAVGLSCPDVWVVSFMISHQFALPQCAPRTCWSIISFPGVSVDGVDVREWDRVTLPGAWQVQLFFTLDNLIAG